MLVLDIETYFPLEEANQFNIETHKISYIGLIETVKREEIDIWEDEVNTKLPSLLSASDLIIGYNIFGYDMPIISRYLGVKVLNYPQLDLMHAVKQVIGYRPKLNDLANATLGRGKLGSGEDAARYYFAKDFDSLKKYCMEDVRLTLEVYEYGLEHGQVKYYDKNGFVKEVQIDWSLGYKNYGKNISANKEEKKEDNLQLFNL